MCRFWISIGKESSVANIRKEFLKLKLDSFFKNGGPDFQNIIRNQGCTAYHSRLAIQDLTYESNQPFVSGGNNILVFNGEIFNWKEILKLIPNDLLEKNINSDTKFLSFLLDNDLIEKYIHKFKGFFSFVYFCSSKFYVSCGRDCFGVKPLYYAYENNKYPIFSSTSEAITLNPAISNSLNPESLGSYLRFGFFPHIKSPFLGINQLLPGTYKKLYLNKDYSLNHKKKIIRFDIEKSIIPKVIKNNNVNFSENYFLNILENACKKRLLADVPISLLLSGGIDSNLLAWIYSEKLGIKLPCFTIAFDNTPKFDESKIASETCRILNLRHEIIKFSEVAMQDKILEIMKNLDQPFIDTSIIPTTLLCSTISNQFKVAISADGGDEGFGGYTKYLENFKFYKYFSKLNFLPDEFFRISNKIDINRFSKIADIFLENKDLDKSIFIHQHQVWPNKIIDKILLNKQEQFDFGCFYKSFEKFNSLSNLSQLQFIDMSFYLKDNILFKINRASMQHGIELREPLLDQDLITYGLSLRSEDKISRKKGKICLRKMLSDKLPHVQNIKKKGFGVPISTVKSFLENREFDIDNLDLSSNLWSVFDRSFVKSLLSKNNLSITQRWHIQSLILWCYLKKI
ncbi:asparagine synthase (glutamine-hydrolyzing) [Prochlorococcus marinus]|uniref:asparagine synthase (glutamine-hydrolyzing) n=1 Tax=Prochlorococcus marinus TaxID=1219 RepID=UPI001ADD0C30|nr:asparagine synthase (glutamine-hydrolyzing) [Prochlorococcus marinus]MBO8219581.1 asparagine synthase (glutamine-hydrolyzing) [Prochlorococcus marinus CUG1416]MBW3051954.1 asparagine synthase (glutamine-hydrolyzing) [Prochlorococcus marinus str. MU1416]